MNADWKPYALETLGKIVTGKTPPSRIKDSFIDSGIPFVTPRDMDGRRWINSTERYLSENGVEAVKNSLVPMNSVAVSCIGSDMGKAVLLSANSVTNQQINSIIVNDELFNPKFIYYILSTKQEELKDIAGGSATPILNKGHFGKYEILAPNKHTQDLIVQQLDSLDSKIELNRQTNQTLEQIAQALFKSWFVDFEPTRAKLKAKQNGQDPQRAAMAAISGKTLAELDDLSAAQQTQLNTTAALFPDALVDSELGEIPEGWGTRPLSAWGNIVCGKTPSKKQDEYYGGGIPFIKIPDMHGNMFVTKTIDSLTNSGAEIQAKKKLPKGSICVSCIATVGQVLITSEDSYTNQQINTIVPEESFYTPYLYFSMLDLHDELHDLASGGSATLNLNTGNFAKIETMFPSNNLLIKFAEITNAWFDKILENYKQQDTLIELRDSLLPKLLSGELSINTTEQKNNKKEVA